MYVYIIHTLIVISVIIFKTNIIQILREVMPREVFKRIIGNQNKTRDIIIVVPADTRSKISNLLAKTDNR